MAQCIHSRQWGDIDACTPDLSESLWQSSVPTYGVNVKAVYGPSDKYLWFAEGMPVDGGGRLPWAKRLSKRVSWSDGSRQCCYLPVPTRSQGCPGPAAPTPPTTLVEAKGRTAVEDPSRKTSNGDGNRGRNDLFNCQKLEEEGLDRIDWMRLICVRDSSRINSGAAAVDQPTCLFSPSSSSF